MYRRIVFFCSWKECSFSQRSKGTVHLEAIITFQSFQGLFKPHVLQHVSPNSLVYGKLVFSLLPQKLLVIFLFIIFTISQFSQDHNKINEKKKAYKILSFKQIIPFSFLKLTFTLYMCNVPCCCVALGHVGLSVTPWTVVL